MFTLPRNKISPIKSDHDWLFERSHKQNWIVNVYVLKCTSIITNLLSFATHCRGFSFCKCQYIGLIITSDPLSPFQCLDITMIEIRDFQKSLVSSNFLFTISNDRTIVRRVAWISMSLSVPLHWNSPSRKQPTNCHHSSVQTLFTDAMWNPGRCPSQRALQ